MIDSSIDGWPGLPSVSDPRLAVGTVPGTNVRLRMREEVLPLFLAVGHDFDTHVAPLRYGECGAYNFRLANAGGGKLSDHGSGTAADFNWGHEGAQGPNGGMRTMSKAQVAACAAIKRKYQILIWGGDKARGGDYAQPVNWDPMHFALKPGTTVADVQRIIEELQINLDGTITPVLSIATFRGPYRGPGTHGPVIATARRALNLPAGDIWDADFTRALGGYLLRHPYLIAAGARSTYLTARAYASICKQLLA